MKAAGTLRFWAGFAWETAAKHAAILSYLVMLLRMMRAIKRDPAAASYTDLALTQGEPEEEAKLELLAPAIKPRVAA